MPCEATLLGHKPSESEDAKKANFAKLQKVGDSSHGLLHSCWNSRSRGDSPEMEAETK